MIMRTKIKALGDRHCLATLTPRLAFITKALKTKAENRLIALYAGFDDLDSAQQFANWAQVSWGKSSFEVEVREGSRTQSAWEVKIRRPKAEHLESLVRVEECRPKTDLLAIPESRVDFPPIPTPTRVKVGNHWASID
jgi:hypothetical protein